LQFCKAALGKLWRLLLACPHPAYVTDGAPRHQAPVALYECRAETTLLLRREVVDGLLGINGFCRTRVSGLAPRNSHSPKCVWSANGVVWDVTPTCGPPRVNRSWASTHRA